MTSTKYLTRCLSLFLCFALLFIGFSSIANAEEVEVKPYKIIQSNYLQMFNEAGNVNFGLHEFYPHNGEVESNSVTYAPDWGDYVTNIALKKAKSVTSFIYGYTDNSNIMEKDKSYKVKLGNIYHSLLVEANSTLFYVRNPYLVTIYVSNGDEEQEIAEYEISHHGTNPYLDIKFEVAPTFDVKVIGIAIYSNVLDSAPSGLLDTQGLPKITSYYGEFQGDDKYQFTLEVESDEVGVLKVIGNILSSIGGWCQNIFSSITSGFSNIGNIITNVWNTIKGLPEAIGNFLLDGIKNLFVPNTNQMVEYSDDWEQLMSTRFGALYEVGDYLHELANAIINAPAMIDEESSSKITLPEVSLENVGIDFKFGGYEVDIVPEGFEFYAVVVKRVTSMICTIAWLMVLRKQYERVVGG